ncbi:MAG TPA: hypothetical protein HPP76_03945 [Desulfuromonadales bacterium]|nr:hypothetical protein [Desulfuromonadales bacterium]
MRKRTVRNGMLLVMAALILIILASFYHAGVTEFFDMPRTSEIRVYKIGIFWAAALGGYGVVLAAFGFVLPADKRDAAVRILPVFLAISVLVGLFFYLLSASFDAPDRREYQRLRPGETITI